MSRAFMIKQAPFKPTDIGGCQLWLDGADTTSSSMTFSSGRNLSVWKDKSTSANNFNLISGTTTSVADGLQNAVYVPSGAVMRSVNQFTLTTSSAYFIVCKLITIGSGSVQNINDVLQFINIPVSGYIPYIRFYQGVLQGTATPGNPGNTNDIGNGNYFVNGTFNPNFDSSYYLNKYVIIDLVSPNVGGTTFLSISDTSFPRPFLGNIGEIICYPGGVTSTQRQQVESYLAQKWGLREQLPQGHPGTRGIVYPSQPIPTAIYWRYQSPFVPSVAGAVSMWLDGTDPAGTGTPPSNGATVSTWVDKSGSGKNLTAVGTPTYVTASSSIYLNGGSYLQNTNFNFTNYTLFIVSVQASDQGPLYTNNTTTGGYSGFFPRFSNGNYYLVQSDSGWLSAGSPFSNGTTYLYSIQYDSLNNINVWSTGSISPVITGTAGTITRNKFLLGNRNSSGYVDNMTGNIFEVIQYNTTLSTLQRQQIEGYLAWKWGLQANLPADHPYKSAAPTSTSTAPARPIISLPRATLGGSFQFTTSPSQYLSIPNSTAFTQNTAFTYEFWYYPTSTNTGYLVAMLQPNWITVKWNIGSPGSIGLDMSYVGNPPGYVKQDRIYAINRWHHIALTWNGTNGVLYVNGVSEAVFTGAGGLVNAGNDLRIGQYQGQGQPTPLGYFTNFRWVKGVSVYTGAFTPPTRPLTVTQSAGTNISAITAGQTQLLISATTSGSLLTDSSTNNFTITNNGSVAWNILTPFS